MKKVLLGILLLVLVIPGVSEAKGRITPESVLEGINAERTKVGVAPLESNELLNKVAAAKANDIVKYKYWSHDNPTTGSTPWTWFKSEGYEYQYAGENLAQYFTKTPDLIKGWVNSPTHYSNIIKTNYTETGIAVVGSLVVQVFASPVGTTKPHVIPTGV